jgi:hypothetical protein
VTQTTGSLIAGPTVSVPANSMGVNGELQVDYDASVNNTSGTKTVDLEFNTTTCLMAGYASDTGGGALGRIRNRGVNNNQICLEGGESFNDSLGSTYMSVATSSAQNLAVELELATATDWIVLESYSFKEWGTNP